MPRTTHDSGERQDFKYMEVITTKVLKNNKQTDKNSVINIMEPPRPTKFRKNNNNENT